MTLDIPLNFGATLMFLVEGADSLCLLLVGKGIDLRLFLD